MNGLSFIIKLVNKRILLASYKELSEVEEMIVLMAKVQQGLPSIVTDINGCNEIIIEGENGMIIPAKDSEALYEKMISFIENSHETKRMAANARKLIVDRYEQKVVWEALLEEYKRLSEN